MIHAPGVAAAVFPHAPERAVYNNAVLEHDLETGRARRRHRRHGGRVHGGRRRRLRRLGARDGPRDDRRARAPRLPVRRDDARHGHVVARIRRRRAGDRHRPPHMARVPGVPRARRRTGRPVATVDATALEVAMARLHGRNVATALSYDHDGDCGIFNVSTLPWARRRGLGSALTALQLHAAKRRGCTTATLQSTAMAERVYAALGFENLGTIREYVRQQRRELSHATHQSRARRGSGSSTARPTPAGGGGAVGGSVRGTHRYRRRGRAGTVLTSRRSSLSHRHRPTSARSRSPPGRHSQPPRHSRRRGILRDGQPRDAVDGRCRRQGRGARPATAVRRRPHGRRRGARSADPVRAVAVTSSRSRLSPKTPLGMNGQTEGTANGAIRPAGVSEAVLRPRRSP